MVATVKFCVTVCAKLKAPVHNKSTLNKLRVFMVLLIFSVISVFFNNKSFVIDYPIEAIKAVVLIGFFSSVRVGNACEPYQWFIDVSSNISCIVCIAKVVQN